MQQYNVTGMTCAACQARVEKAVAKVDGVTSCSVSLLTNSMGVEGTAMAQDIIKAVEDAGYGASERNEGAKSFDGHSGNSVISGLEESLKDTTTPLLAKRLVSSLVFLLILMYFSMGHMMWGWPLPKVLEDNHGTCSDVTYDYYYGNQSALFYKWHKKCSSWFAKHGYACFIRFWCSIFIQYICAFCYDRCTTAYGHGSGHALYA